MRTGRLFGIWGGAIGLAGACLAHSYLWPMLALQLSAAITYSIALTLQHTIPPALIAWRMGVRYGASSGEPPQLTLVRDDAT